jgi:hypothetical protein
MREGFDGNSSLGSSLWGGGGGSAFGGAGVGGSVDEKARIAQLEMAMGEVRIMMPLPFLPDKKDDVNQEREMG